MTDINVAFPFLILYWGFFSGLVGTWKKDNGINGPWIVMDYGYFWFRLLIKKKIEISHALWKAASSLLKSRLSSEKVDLFLNVNAVCFWTASCVSITIFCRFCHFPLVTVVHTSFMPYTRCPRLNFFFCFCRVPEDCHGNSNRLCDNGIYWFLCQIDPYPNQQYHCVSKYELAISLNFTFFSTWSILNRGC